MKFTKATNIYDSKVSLLVIAIAALSLILELQIEVTV